MYLLRYHQKTRDDLAYRRICEALRAIGFVREISRGEFLVEPACQAHLFRVHLRRCAAPEDAFVLSPVLVKALLGRDARAYVDGAGIALSPPAPFTREERLALLDS